MALYYAYPSVLLTKILFWKKVLLKNVILIFENIKKTYLIDTNTIADSPPFSSLRFCVGLCFFINKRETPRFGQRRKC